MCGLGFKRSFRWDDHLEKFTKRSTFPMKWGKLPLASWGRRKLINPHMSDGQETTKTTSALLVVSLETNRHRGRNWEACRKPLTKFLILGFGPDCGARNRFAKVSRCSCLGLSPHKNAASLWFPNRVHRAPYTAKPGFSSGMFFTLGSVSSWRRAFEGEPKSNQPI